MTYWDHIAGFWNGLDLRMTLLLIEGCAVIFLAMLLIGGPIGLAEKGSLHWLWLMLLAPLVLIFGVPFVNWHGEAMGLY